MIYHRAEPTQARPTVYDGSRCAPHGIKEETPDEEYSPLSADTRKIEATLRGLFMGRRIYLASLKIYFTSGAARIRFLLMY